MRVDAQNLTLSWLVVSALAFVSLSKETRVEGQLVQLRRSVDLLDGVTIPKGSLGSIVSSRREKGADTCRVRLEGLRSDPAGAVVELSTSELERVKPMPEVGRAEEIDHISCQVCQLLVREGRHLLESKGISDTDAISDIVEDLCSPNKLSGRWLKALDLSQEEDKINVMQRETFGDCRGECSIAQHSCKKTLKWQEDSLISELLETPGNITSIPTFCSVACKNTPKRLKGRRVDEIFRVSVLGQHLDDLYGFERSLDALTYKRLDELDKKLSSSGQGFDAAADGADLADLALKFSEHRSQLKENKIKKRKIPRKDQLAHQASKTVAIKATDLSQAAHDENVNASSAEIEILASSDTAQIADPSSSHIEVERRASRKDVQSSRSNEAEHVKCQVCKILKQSGRVFFQQAGMLKSTVQAQDALDQICVPQKPAGQWLRTLDLQTVGSSIMVVQQASFGKCRRECFVAQRACESLLEGLEDDLLQHFLSTGGSSKVKNLCEEVCEKPRAPLRGKRVDEVFIKGDVDDDFPVGDQALDDLLGDLEKDVPQSGLDLADHMSSGGASTPAPQDDRQPCSVGEAQKIDMEAPFGVVLKLFCTMIVCCLLFSCRVITPLRKIALTKIRRHASGLEPCIQYPLKRGHHAGIKLFHIPSQLMAMCNEGAHMRACLVSCLSVFGKLAAHANAEPNVRQQAQGKASEENVLVQDLQTQLCIAAARLHELEVSLEKDRLARQIAEDATREATRQAQLQQQAFEGERRAKLQAESAARELEVNLEKDRLARQIAEDATREATRQVQLQQQAFEGERRAKLQAEKTARKSDTEACVQQEAWPTLAEATSVALKKSNSRGHSSEQEFFELAKSNAELKFKLKSVSQQLADEKACRLVSEEALKLAEARCRRLNNEDAQALESLPVMPVASLKEDQILNSLQHILREHAGFRPKHEVQLLEVKSLGFTHDTIAPKFRDGRTLEELVEDLVAGRVDAARHPNLLLDVVCFRGAYLSLNNRRLWALKQYQQYQLGSITGKRGRSQIKPVCVRAHVFQLCPVTAKFVLSNTSQTSGASTEIRRSVSRQPRSSSHAVRSVSHGFAKTEGRPHCQQRSISRTPATKLQVTVREDVDIVSALPSGLQDRAHRSASQRRWQKHDGVASSCVADTSDSKSGGDSTNTSTATEGVTAVVTWEKYRDPETSKVWWWHPVEQRAVYNDPCNGAV